MTKTVITTAHGHSIDFANRVYPEQIDTRDIVQGLVHGATRFGGHAKRHPGNLSVARHSLAAMIVASVIKNPITPNIVMKAGLHDAHEAYMGDIVSPFKAAVMQRCPAIREIQDTLQDGIWLKYGFHEEVGRSDDDRADIKEVDTFCMLYESITYHPSRGVRAADEFNSWTPTHLPSLEELNYIPRGNEPWVYENLWSGLHWAYEVISDDDLSVLLTRLFDGETTTVFAMDSGERIKA